MRTSLQFPKKTAMTPEANARGHDQPKDLPWRFVLFDLDGTLVQGTVYVWQSLHDHFGTDRRRRRRAREDFFSGRITYEDWFRHDLELLREAGATKQRMVEMIRQTMWLTPGARQTLQVLRAAGLKLGVLSGSLDLVLQVLLPDFSFDEVLINRIAFHEDGTIAGGTHTPFDLEHKATGLLHLAATYELSPREFVFVGDNENDLAVARIAGLAVAFRPKSARLRATAHHVIEEPDLRALLPLVGLPATSPV